jgi:hypothetical protein
VDRDHPVQVTHDALDLLLDKVADLLLSAPASEALAAWRIYERDVRLHFAAEERRLMPAYARVEPDEVERLEEAHDLLRNRVRAFRMQLERCGDDACGPLERKGFGDLVALFRDHQRQEDAGIYAWARESQLRPSTLP